MHVDGIGGRVLTAGVLALTVLAAPGKARAQEADGQPEVVDTAAVSLSLAGAVAEAAEGATGVTLAGLRSEEAEGRLTQARSVYFPTFGGSGGYIRQSMNREAFGIEFPTPPGEPPPPARIGPFDLWDLRADAAQTLFSPAGWLNARAAHGAVDASVAEVATAMQTAGAQTALAYVGAVQARATLAARERELELAQDLLDVAEAQLRSGVATRLDEVRARTQVAAAQAAVEAAAAQSTSARIELARSLGVPTDVQFELTDTLGPQLGRSEAPVEHDSAIEMALERRPERDVARARQTAARTAARAVAAQRFGQLQAVGNWGLNGPTPDETITTGQIAIQYSIPVFEGFRLKGERRELEARASQAAVQLADLDEQITGEVETALAAVESGEARQVLAQEQVALAEEEVREARLLFANGVAGNIEVINAQSDLVRANNAMIDALAQTARARVQLARAVGVTRSLQ